jgi:hypothetical protein
MEDNAGVILRWYGLGLDEWENARVVFSFRNEMTKLEFNILNVASLFRLQRTVLGKLEFVQRIKPVFVLKGFY